MANQLTGNVRTGYRTVGVLLFVGLTSIGFTRFEDRAIIGVPGSPASAMSALAVPDGEETESYADAPDNSVSLNNISRAPTNRIRRVLRDRDLPAGASREILAPGAPENPFLAEVQNGAGTDPTSAGQGFAPLDAPPAAFASLAPPLAGQGGAVFNAPLAAEGGNAGGGAAGGGVSGDGDGGNGDGGNGGETPGSVSPVPEPGTWLMLMLGLFGIGTALRHRNLGVVSQAVRQLG